MSGPTQPKPPRPRLTLVAVVLIVVGLTLAAIGVWQALHAPTSFGWFAYAPLSETTFPALPAPGMGAIALVGLGSLLAGLGAGIVVGRRTR